MSIIPIHIINLPYLNPANLYWVMGSGTVAHPNLDILNKKLNSLVPFCPKPPIYIVKGGDGQMATEVMNSSQLRIEYNHGMDLDGKPIYKAKTIIT